MREGGTDRRAFEASRLEMAQPMWLTRVGGVLSAQGALVSFSVWSWGGDIGSNLVLSVGTLLEV